MFVWCGLDVERPAGGAATALNLGMEQILLGKQYAFNRIKACHL
jgi:hypothetical protein